MRNSPKSVFYCTWNCQNLSIFFKKFASRNYLDESGREEDNDNMRITLKGQKEEDKMALLHVDFFF